MNIFFRELRANFKSLIIWCVIIVMFVAVGFAKFSAYEGNPELLAVLDGVPPAMLAAFNLNAFNLTTITGFYGVMFTYFALILSIAAVMWGSDIITKEERDKTVEFALTLPVRRSQVITGKLFAALVNCIVLLLFTAAAVLLNALQYQRDNQFYQFVAISMLALFLLQMVFLAIGIFLGCAMKSYKRASSVALAILLGTYFISIVAGLHKNLDFLKYLSPFKYFDAAALLHDSSISSVYLVLTVVIVAACLVGAYMTYGRRDLYI